MTRMPRGEASFTIASISAGLPNRCGTIIALVFSVRTGSTVFAVKLRSSPMSASTGRAPTARIGNMTLVQQNVGITTSSFFFTLHARSAISRANFPDPQRTASLMPTLSVTSDPSASRSGPSTTAPENKHRRMARYVAPFQYGTHRGTRHERLRRVIGSESSEETQVFLLLYNRHYKALDSF